MIGILRVLESIGADFEKNMNLIPKQSQKIRDYHRQIMQVKQSMQNITNRIQLMQGRLNRIRQRLPPNSTVLIEKPNKTELFDTVYYYRCILPNGMRYMSKPSKIANFIQGKIIKHNEMVQVVERVFICNENSVYLHVLGSGWLVENHNNTQCMERCAGKSPSIVVVAAPVVANQSPKP